MQLATTHGRASIIQSGLPLPADPNAANYYVLYTLNMGRLTVCSRPAADAAISQFGRRRLVRVNHNGDHIDLG
jgi:hypothetical protein